ncbi:MAG: EamA family transporter [Nanoarchaeota archaeon]|nr:EamA family transporter [Nanoarchaeota archaeon]MBU4493398.1 EamA family transporter [Nanoarchaeota archaeon]
MQWYVFAILTALLTAAAAIVEKKTLLKEHAMEFSTVLAVFNFFIVLVLLPYINFNFSLKILAMIYTASVFATIAFLFVAKAVRHMDISIVSPLLSFSPAVVAVLAFFILGERITYLQLFGILLLILGSFVLEAENHNTKKIFTKKFKSNYFYYIILALTLYGFCSILDKFILNTISPLTYIPIVHFFIAINFIILICIFHNGFEGIKHGIKSAGKWIFLVAILVTGYRLSQAQAISMTYVSLVIPIKRMSAFFATIVGGRVFHEKNLAKRTLACIIMLAGSFLVILG